LCRVNQEATELDHEGIVEAELVAELLALHRRGVLAHHAREGIADVIEEAERDEPDRQHDGKALADAADDEGDHARALLEVTRAPFARRRREHRKIGAVRRLSIFAGGRERLSPGRGALGAARGGFRPEAQHHLLAVIRVDDQALEVDGFLWRLVGRARHRRPSFTVIGAVTMGTSKSSVTCNPERGPLPRDKPVDIRGMAEFWSFATDWDP